MQPIGHLPNSSILAFNLERAGGDTRLKLIRGLVVAGPQYFLCQDETHGFDPIVEPSQQAIAVVNESTVLPKNYEHHDAQRAFAGALPAALEHDNGAWMLVGVLHSPGKPTHEVFELGFVPSTNDLQDMS